MPKKDNLLGAVKIGLTIALVMMVAAFFMPTISYALHVVSVQGEHFLQHILSH